ncbi:MAG: DUF6054 family protein [Eubacteriales bacterium]|nr:DUF6054 family protein [Eubacteriales bacterium]
MAKCEKMVTGDFDEILQKLNAAVMINSMSATYEDGSDFSNDGFRCAVRVYERYSILGSNRVSLNITLAGKEGNYFLSAITSGGSQAIRMKLNTYGEESFLDTIKDVVDSL